MFTCFKEHHLIAVRVYSVKCESREPRHLTQTPKFLYGPQARGQFFFIILGKNIKTVVA